MMSGASTSSIADSVFETSDDITFGFSGMVVGCYTPELMFAPVSDMFAVTSGIHVSSKIDLTGVCFRGDT